MISIIFYFTYNQQFGVNELVTLRNIVSTLCISYSRAIPKFIVQYLESVALIHYVFGINIIDTSISVFIKPQINNNMTRLHACLHSIYLDTSPVFSPV